MAYSSGSILPTVLGRGDKFEAFFDGGGFNHFPNLNVFNQSWENNTSKTAFNLENLPTLRFRSRGGDFVVYDLYLFIGDTQIGWIDTDKYQTSGIIIVEWTTRQGGAIEVLDPSNGDSKGFLYKSGIVVPLTYAGDKIWIQRYGIGDIQSFEVKQLEVGQKYSSAQTLGVYLKIRYRPGTDVKQESSGASMDTIKIGEVSVLNPVVNSISLSGQKTSFYKNEPFSLGNIVVTGSFNYQIGAQHAYNAAVNGYTFNPASTSSVGEKTVSISYNGKNATYKVNVYGVKNYNKPTLKSTFKIGESKGNLTSTITYDDGTSETVNVNVSGFDTSSQGSKTITYSITATKTGETFTWTSNIQVYPLTHITINADSCTKNFNANSTFNYSGLVVTAHFGANDEAGTQVVSPDSVTCTNWSVGASKEVVVSYQGKTDKYYININGVYSLDVNITGCSLYDAQTGGFRYAKGTPFVTAGKTASVRRYLNGVLQTAQTWSGTIGVENKNGVCTFTVTEDGASASCTYPVVEYECQSLRIENKPTIFYVRGGVYPTFQISNMSVIEITSDGREDILTRNATIKGYTISPEVSSTLALGKTQVTITSTSGLVEKFDIECVENHPKADAEIIVEGSLLNTVYSKGQTVDLSGLTVKVSKMEAGETNYIVPFTAVLSGKNTLTFGNDFEEGNYDLVISVDGVEDTATIADAVILDGISSVTGVTCSRKYKSGEAFDKSTISGTITYLSGKTRSIVAKDIESAPDTVHYGEDENTTLTICGVSASVTIQIIKVVELSVEPKNTAALSYLYGAKFNRDNFTATKKYSDNTTESVPMSELEFVCDDVDENELTPVDSTNEVLISFFYYEDEFEVYDSLTIYVKAINSVKVIDEYANQITKLAFEYGEELDLSDYYIFISYNDGTSDQYAVDKFIVSTEDVLGTQVKAKLEGTVSASCGTQNVTSSLTIHCHYLDSIDVDFSGISEDLYAYDTLDLTSVTATRTIKSTDSSETNYPQTDNITDELHFVFNGQNIGVDNFLMPGAGTYTLSASYTLNNQTKSENVSLTIETVVLESIEVVTSAAFKPLEDYVEDQNLNLTGLEIALHYNKSASDHNLSYNDPNIVIVDIDDTQISKTKLLELADDGKELFAKYGDEIVSIGTLSVEAKAISSIEVANNPTTLTYTYGDRFSIDGLVIKAIYNNGSTEIVPLSEIEISGIAIGHTFNPTEDTTFDDITITVEYEGKTCSFDIELVAPQIDYVETNASDKSGAVQLQFRDRSVFSMSGLIVTAVMKNGWKKTIDTYVENSTEVLGLDSQGKINVTGSYGYKSIRIDVTNPYDNTDTASVNFEIEVVSSGDITSALLKLEDNYKEYIVGDKFTAKGVSFTVTDIDGNTWNATNIVTEPAIGTTLRSAQRITVKASYSNGSFSRTETFDIIVSVPNSIELVETNTYEPAIAKANGDAFGEIHHEEATIKIGKVYDDYGNLTGEFYPIFHEDKISISDNPLLPDLIGFNVYTGTDVDGDCIGYIDLGNGDVRNAHIILFNDPVNPIDGDSNIEVLFPHYVEGNADKINKCKFGIVFNNRLFVSGNTDFKNMDFHTSETNNEINEFTYFSDLDYCKYGSDSKAVVGYDIYRDGDLLVFKEGSRNEATMYRRSLKLSQASDYAGNVVSENLGEETYPCFPVNTNGGVGALSNRSIVNFLGETLVLTEEGIKAITSKEDIYNNAKYSFDVSTYINPKIKNEGLKYSYMFTHKDKVILKTNRGIYVGYHEIRNDNNEYEWYFLDNISSDLMFDIDGQLFFANNKGELCRFNEKDANKYFDKSRVYVGTGGTTLDIDEGNNRIIVNGNYSDYAKEGYAFHLITEYNILGEDIKTQVHASLGYFVNINTRNNSLGKPDFNQALYIGLIDPTDNTIRIQPYKVDGSEDDSRKATERVRFYDGREIYLDKLIGNGLKVYVRTRYYLHCIDQVTDTYTLQDEYGNTADLSGIETMRVSFIVNDLAITKIVNVDTYSQNAKSFQLFGDHDSILDLIYYNDIEDANYKGVITIPEIVEAFYITAPLALGSMVSWKTIWQWVVANDTALASYMDVGFLSSHKQGDYGMSIKTQSGSRQLDFGDFEFEKVQFTSDKLPHIYTKMKRVPRVGFIRFLFRNNEASNMVLTTLQLVYTISLFTKGER